MHRLKEIFGDADIVASSEITTIQLKRSLNVTDHPLDYRRFNEIVRVETPPQERCRHFRVQGQDMGSIDYVFGMGPFLVAVFHHLKLVDQEVCGADLCGFRIRLRGGISNIDRKIEQVSPPSVMFFGPQVLANGVKTTTSDTDRSTSLTIFMDLQRCHDLHPAQRKIINNAMERVDEIIDGTNGILWLPNHPRVLQLAAEIEASQPQMPHFQMVVESRVLEVLTLLFDLLCKDPDDSFVGGISPAEIKKINTARQIIDENFDQRLTLPELARSVGLNRRKLSEGFNTLFGTSVHQYLTRRRLEVAVSRLIEGEPLGRIAMDVGYTDVSSLTRAIRKHYDQTPGELRQSMMAAS